MSSDLFGGIMKNIGAFMPQDDPNVVLFQKQNELQDLQKDELGLYAKIGKKAFPGLCSDPDYSDLVQELNYTQKKIKIIESELSEAQSERTLREQKERDSMISRTCPNCETLNPEGVKFCQECGARLNQATKVTCPDCSAEFPVGTRFCGECGRQL